MDTKHIIVVGSTNPVKIESTSIAVHQCFKDIVSDVVGVSSPSGVSDQPVGDDETRQGAENRARHAYETYERDHGTKPKYGIGLEGGVGWTAEKKLECFAWAAVYDGERFGTAKSATFILPKAISDLVESGVELGVADDMVFKTTNSKQKEGTIGHLTKGVISRTQYYTPVVTLAFVPFMWPDMYD